MHEQTEQLQAIHCSTPPPVRRRPNMLADKMPTSHQIRQQRRMLCDRIADLQDEVRVTYETVQHYTKPAEDRKTIASRVEGDVETQLEMQSMFEVEPCIDDTWSLRTRQINAESAEQIQEYLAMLVTNANEEHRQTRSRVTPLLEEAKAELGRIDGRIGGRIEGVNDARSGSSDPTTDAPATASQQSYESDVDGRRQTRLTEFFVTQEEWTHL